MTALSGPDAKSDLAKPGMSPTCLDPLMHGIFHKCPPRCFAAAAKHEKRQQWGDSRIPVAPEGEAYMAEMRRLSGD
jgi:hypothetical protein